eukprot:2884833-Rhodomonas_salina.1
MQLGGWNASGKVLCVIWHATEGRGVGKQICMVACELFQVSGSTGGRGGSCICCPGRHRVGCGRDGWNESGTCGSYV